MRTTLFVITVAVAAALAGGCGKKKDNADQDKAGPPATDPNAATTTAGADAAPARPPEPARPAVIMPADVSADKPISVAEMDGIVKQWADGTEVTFTGYPAFFIGDSDVMARTVYVAAQPEQKKDTHLIECEPAESEKDKKIDNKTPVTLKGKLDGRTGMKYEFMRVKDCVLVAQGTPAKAEATPAPGNPEPVAVDKLAAAYMGWFGKEVSVTGYYMGITTSKNKDGKLIDVRVDLLTEGGNFDTKVGCHLALVEPDAALTALMDKNRSALTVRGTFKEVVFGGAQLEPCTVTSK